MSMLQYRTLTPIGLLMTAVIAFVAMPGCTRTAASDAADTGRASSPQFAVRPTEPTWTFDSPEYARPAAEPDPAVREHPHDPLHFFINRHLIYIRKPAAAPAEQQGQRVALYVTRGKNGTWAPIGHFGLGQTFFPYEVSDDGDYGIRFAAPEEAGRYSVPERVYHVDTTPPNAWVTIEPLLAAYRAGQIVTLDWGAFDHNLIEKPVQISVNQGDDAWRLVVTDQPSFGALAFAVPAAAEGTTVQFKIEALDRAGNLGTAQGPKLRVAAHADIVADKSGNKPTAIVVDLGAHPRDDVRLKSLLSDTAPTEPVKREPDSSLPATSDEATTSVLGVENAMHAITDAVEDSLLTAADLPDPTDTAIASAESALREMRESLCPLIERAAPLELTAVMGSDAACMDRLEPLVPTLPALATNDAADRRADERPWQSLGQYASELGARIWALPRPQFLTDLAAFVEQHIGDVPQGPVAPARDPVMVKAGAENDGDVPTP